jgi:hypothetical protein
MFRPRLLLSLAALFLLCGAGAVAAFDEPLAARGGEGKAVYFFPAGSELRLESGQPEATPVALPAGTLLKSAAAAGGGWLLAGAYPRAEGGSELFLLAGDGTGEREIPPPGPRRGRLRAEPVWLANGGRSQGLLWLEGDDRRSLALRYAPFDGERFGTPVEVAPPAAGSQLALAAAPLSDGSFLALWSAFDGQDDEILWSHGRAGEWRDPQPLAPDNDVPDITPAVAALGDGAIAAWNRFDPELGAYRLLTARFDGERWREPAVIEGAGGLYPTFERLDGTLYLLCLRAGTTRGWGLLRLTEEGRVAREADVETARAERPLLVTDPGTGGLALRWEEEEIAVRWERTPRTGRLRR